MLKQKGEGRAKNSMQSELRKTQSLPSWCGWRGRQVKNNPHVEATMKGGKITALSMLSLCCF
ncbi:MAG: hypothetical protein DRN17_00125 [Thermoplasmata archaeon]|nr:MAG: hypothetical protein DRN17_00125 [Thermoplasmata archaeon]